MSGPRKARDQPAISVHSFRRGTEKSNLAANVAAVLAGEERRVALIEIDIQSPGLRASVARGMSLPGQGDGLRGRTFLIQSSTKPGEFTVHPARATTRSADRRSSPARRGTRGLPATEEQEGKHAGCETTRDTESAITAAGFRFEDLEHGFHSSSALAITSAPYIVGRARPRA